MITAEINNNLRTLSESLKHINYTWGSMNRKPIFIRTQSSHFVENHRRVSPGWTCKTFNRKWRSKLIRLFLPTNRPAACNTHWVSIIIILSPSLFVVKGCHCNYKWGSEEKRNWRKKEIISKWSKVNWSQRCRYLVVTFVTFGECLAESIVSVWESLFN